MRIKKTSQYIEGGASISNVYGTSQEDGYSQEYINGLGTYSTDEVRIGTYLGKPLYRKYIEVAGDTSFNYTVTNMKELVNIYGYCYVSNQTQYHRPFPFISSGATLLCTYYQNGILYFESDRTNNKVFLTIEYTKTTD